MCKIRWLRAKALSRRHGRQRDTVDRRRCHGRRLEPNNANASSSFELSEQEFCREVTQHDDDDDDDDGGDPLDRSGRQKSSTKVVWYAAVTGTLTVMETESAGVIHAVTLSCHGR
jgi:hypothetical protein